MDMYQAKTDVGLFQKVSIENLNSVGKITFTNEAWHGPCAVKLAFSNEYHVTAVLPTEHLISGIAGVFCCALEFGVGYVVESIFNCHKVVTDHL